MDRRAKITFAILVCFIISLTIIWQYKDTPFLMFADTSKDQPCNQSISGKLSLSHLENGEAITLKLKQSDNVISETTPKNGVYNFMYNNLHTDKPLKIFANEKLKDGELEYPIAEITKFECAATKMLNLQI